MSNFLRMFGRNGFLAVAVVALAAPLGCAVEPDELSQVDSDEEVGEASQAVLTNAAVNKAYFLSMANLMSNPANMVDGNTSTITDALVNIPSYLQQFSGPVFGVDLGTAQNIGYVRIMGGGTIPNVPYAAVPSYRMRVSTDNVTYTDVGNIGLNTAVFLNRSIRTVRIYPNITANTSYAARISEFQIFGIGANLAKGKTTASSCYAGNDSGPSAVDGNTGTAFLSPSLSVGNFWQVDLGSSQKLGTMFTYDTKVIFNTSLQYSTDGATWIPKYGCGSVPLPVVGTSVVPLDVTARYVKLYACSYSSPQQMGFSEAVIYEAP